MDITLWCMVVCRQQYQLHWSCQWHWLGTLLAQFAPWPRTLVECASVVSSACAWQGCLGSFDFMCTAQVYTRPWSVSHCHKPHCVSCVAGMAQLQFDIVPPAHGMNMACGRPHKTTGTSDGHQWLSLHCVCMRIGLPGLAGGRGVVTINQVVEHYSGTGAMTPHEDHAAFRLAFWGTSVQV